MDTDRKQRNEDVSGGKGTLRLKKKYPKNNRRQIIRFGENSN